jgi:nucleoside phosphorylase
MSSLPVHLVTALPAEAKPVITRFGLKRLQPDCSFPVYRSRHISLVVSGVGKANAAAAVALLQALSGCPKRTAWINLGIAGHADLPLGQAVLAENITDAASGNCWRLPAEPDPPCPSVDLVTVDRPDLNYRRECAFDMEAGGFYPTALRFSPPALVLCLKVISDNREQIGWGISSGRVRELIERHLDLLEHMMDRLTTGDRT